MSQHTGMPSTQWFADFASSNSNAMSSNNNSNNPSTGMYESSTGESNSQTKVYVEHNYQDHYRAPLYRPHEDSTNKRRGPRGGVLVPFPEKLYQMLNQISKDGLDDVVSWQPHGRCFVVHQPERFVEEVMPRYFSQTKLTSFQRQVNLYGFRRLTAGSDRNGYYHEMFLRGRPDLLKRMTRVRVKGIGCKLAPSPNTEPNFYRMPYCHPERSSFQEDMLTARVVASTQSASSFSDPTSSIVSIGMAQQRKGKRAFAGARGQSRPPFANTFLEQRCMQQQSPLPCSAQSSSQLPMPDLMSSTLPVFTDGTCNSNPVDLTPLPANTQGSYLMEMQDDIIALLSSNTALLQQEPTDIPSFAGSSDNHNILTDFGSNFWEL
ncbi:Heat stress transcription factor [Seminavis robusta]|uniref:Heat stress transcription factor n=1 Tax=Seminavis robusta TaxID=568900 RepID=A0A9N8HB46_9STRA|nr:Heat stress transcription factor [Seminavis robusta]|eukprot:Sro248_g098370.1 Heat stress transcription factor (377) ;mRNA; r:51130-52356